MRRRPRVSVIIPTRGRPEAVRACVRALEDQTLPACEYEVLVGIDGHDDADLRACFQPTRAEGPHVQVLSMPRQGQASVRNHLLESARGEVGVFLNDDMIPARDLLERHVAAHDARTGTAIVIGSAPWTVHKDDNAFDVLVRESSIIFFYNRMNTPEARAEPDRDWGFRHAWMLNLSIPLGAVRDAGGISVFPTTYGYEDDELAWRLARAHRAPVLYRPDCVAVHDHRVTPAEYMAREYTLGYAAWGFANAAPRCAYAMFKRDVRTKEEVARCSALIAERREACVMLAEWLVGLWNTPAAAWHNHDGIDADRIAASYEFHLPLKRWLWACGLLDASRTAPPRPRGQVWTLFEASDSHAASSAARA